MNKGIKLAKGSWLNFRGSDDNLFDENVLLNIKTHIKNEIDILYGNVIIDNKIHGEEFTYEKLFHNNICHQSIFYNGNVFKTLGNFNRKFLASADWLHNLAWIK